MSNEFKVVQDVVGLEEVKKVLSEYSGKIAFNVLVTTFKQNFIKGGNTGLLGLSFSIKGNSWYIPLSETGRDDRFCTVMSDFNREKEHEIINTYFKEILETKDIVCHDPRNLLKVLMAYGVFVNVVDSSYILLKISDMFSNADNSDLSLQNCMNMFFSRELPDMCEFLQFGTPIDEIGCGFCMITEAILDLNIELQRSHLKTGLVSKELYDLEIGFSKVVAYSEYYGVYNGEFKFPEIDQTYINGIIRVKKPNYVHYYSNEYVAREGYYCTYTSRAFEEILVAASLFFKDYIDEFNENDVDVYKYFASKAFLKEIDEVTVVERYMTKVILFFTGYGKSDEAVHERLSELCDKNGVRVHTIPKREHSCCVKCS